MTRQMINFGLIGCGLMGREFASAAARWLHLDAGRSAGGLGVEPRITGVCSRTPASMAWFERNVPSVQLATTDYRELLADPEIDAIYCAVPHDLHEQIYIDTIRAGKHLLGEKPFGIDLAANQAILHAAAGCPDVLVRCASEFPFYPGAYQIGQWAREERFGTIIEVEAGFWHSSDLNPEKPINWKRRIETNGEYGCMGDLGLHVVHMPFRFGWRPVNVRALLSKIVPERPDGQGGTVPCETWDNALLACEATSGSQTFPMLLSTKRIAPGHGNTWFIKVTGTELSASFSTLNPKQLAYLPYTPGDDQAWRTLDLLHASAYPTITGSIFEFGFSDAILQMWAAFSDELVNGETRQPFHCATPEETLLSHQLFTAALASQQTGKTIPV
jgi:predicted dehydrogenase